MPIPKVIDLSHHNTVPKDFMAAKQAGIIGIIHKLTEGSSYVDDKVTARKYLADQAGLLWGVYHFMRPGDMGQQAAFFIDQGIRLGVIEDNTVLVADHEDQNVPGQSLKQFLDIVEESMQRSPVVYSGHVLKEQLAGTGYKPRRRLWLCQYTSGTPTLPEGIDKYWMWQYTDEGSIGGLSPVDLNDIGNTPVPEFVDGWAGHYEPVPVPPAGPIPTLTISSDRPVNIHIGPNVTIV